MTISFRRIITVLLIASVISGCTTIKEAMAYKRVFKELSELTFNFYRQESISYGSHEREFYLSYFPEEQTQQEIIFFIHGGGWKSGSPQEFEYLAYYFTQRGYRVIMAGYPLIQDTSMESMKNSLEKCFLQVYQDFHIQGDTRFILGGASAGSHLAANLYFDSLKPHETERESITAFFSLSGVLDFEMCNNSIINGMIKGISAPDSNPVDLLNSESTLPIFLLHSRSDGIVEWQNSRSFGEEARSMGNQVTILEMEGDSHDESYVYPFLHETEVIGSFEEWLREAHPITTQQ